MDTLHPDLFWLTNWHKYVDNTKSQEEAAREKTKRKGYQLFLFIWQNTKVKAALKMCEREERLSGQ